MNIYLDLFLSFLKIGFFTIGGGLAMLPLIANVTINKGWISSELLYDFVAVAESTPGPFAINVATYIGYHMGGIFGAICAVAGFFIPSFVIIFIIFKVSQRLLNNQTVKDAFTGLRPAVIGLIMSAMITISFATLYTDKLTGIRQFNWIGLIITVLLFSLMQKFKKIHPIFFIILSAGLGMGIFSILNYFSYI